MKIIYLLLFCSFPIFGQTIYLPHEVEKVAEPPGGFAYLNQFINSNLQIPFTSAVKGLNGRVYVKGVVETDGSMSSREVSKGLDSMCDQEAIRIFSLYKAWKPALLKGEKVRQSIVYPVVFLVAPKLNFDSTEFTFVEYMDDKYLSVSDPKKYKYRSILPVDKRGYVRDNIVYEQLKGGKWKPKNTVPFLRKELMYKSHNEKGSLDSIKAYEISARTK